MAQSLITEVKISELNSYYYSWLIPSVSMMGMHEFHQRKSRVPYAINFTCIIRPILERLLVLCFPLFFIQTPYSH